MKMMMTSILALFLLGGTNTARGDELTIMSYNVENLFDDQDDPDNDGDNEYLPGSAKDWTAQRYKRKLENLASVIKKVNSDRGPDVMGLCEIENEDVVKALVKELTPLGRSYQVIHKQSPDKRGIDCAIVYDAARVTLVSSCFLVVDAGKTREIAGAKFTAAGKTLHVFMNHWPSRANPPEHRATAAKTLRARIDQLLGQDAAADIVVMGDLNDHPSDDSIKIHLKASASPTGLASGEFYDTSASFAPGEGTYVYQGQWEIIDHLIISPGLLDNQGFRWKQGSTQPVKFDFQLFTPASGQPRPDRTYSGNSYHASGISDHLPILAVLEFTP